MPKDTFFKLPQEKQDRILDAALDEFIKYKDNYEKASVKRIAKEADIAIGSIYKYFEDKDDLFFYIFDKNRDEGKTLPKHNTFRSFSEMITASQDSENETNKILMDIVMANKGELFKAFIFDDSPNSQIFREVCSYIEKDKQNNLIKDDVDTDMTAYMYFGIEYIAYNYCKRMGINYNDDNEIIDKMTEIFFSGIYR